MACTLLTLLPAHALQLPPDAVVTPFHAGAWRFSIRRPAEPLAIDGFLWNRSEKRLALSVSAGQGQIKGMEPTSRQIQRLATPQSRPIAAVNGDFYNMQVGFPVGLFVRDGELQAPGNHRDAFVVLDDGTPGIATFETRISLTTAAGKQLDITRLNTDRPADTLVLYSPAWAAATATNNSGVEVALKGGMPLKPNGSATLTVYGQPVSGQGNLPIPRDGCVLSAHGEKTALLKDLKPGETLTLTTATTPNLPLREAIGGHPILVRGGEVVYPGGANEPRHPRTGMGYDDEQIMAVAVDGRRPGHSRGMTLPELAQFLKGVGCKEGINLDGGGSTTCWVRNRILNRPSDGRERSVANALALLSTAPVGRPEQLEFDPPGPLTVAAGARCELRAVAVDALFNPDPRNAAPVWRVEGGVGRFDHGTFVAGDSASEGTLVARVGDVEGRLAVQVVETVAQLVASPTQVETAGLRPVTIKVSGRDDAGHALPLDPARLAWQLPDGWTRQPNGELTATREGARGKLVVRGYGASCEVPLAAAQAVLLDDFETDPAPLFSGIPASVTGSAECLEGDAAQGRRFARLTYHLGDPPGTRAAYLRLDRPLGVALAIRAAVRAHGEQLLLRAVVVDGNGIRTLHTFLDGKVAEGWMDVTAELPEGLKRPLTLQSVYVVALRADSPRDGTLDWDRLQVLQVEESAP